MRKDIWVLAAILALACASSNGVASGSKSGRESTERIPDLPMAIAVAQDFSSRLNEEKDLSWQWGEYVSNAKNYAVGAVEQSDYYVVAFVLRQPVERINGGGGRYRIDKMSGKWTFLGLE